MATVLVDALAIVTGNLDRPGGLVFGDSPIDTAGLSAGRRGARFGNIRTRIGDLADVGGSLPWVLPDEIVTTGKGQVRALIVTAGNPVISTPAGDRLEAALGQLDLMVAIDLYVNETGRHADYVLPAPTFIERDDAIVFGAEHMPRVWVQATTAVVQPPGQVRDEWRVFAELGERLGFDSRFDHRGVVDAMLRNADVSDNPELAASGMSLAWLEQQPHGVVVREHVRTGTARRHITHPNGKAQLAAPDVLDQLRRLDDDAWSGAPLRLFGRRQLRDINSWMHNLGRSPEPALHVHPRDSASCGISDGERARLSTASGAIEVLVHVTDDVVQGSVSYPHGFGHGGGSWKLANNSAGANVNRLAPDDIDSFDELSGGALLDGIPAWLERLA